MMSLPLPAAEPVAVVAPVVVPVEKIEKPHLTLVPPPVQAKDNGAAEGVEPAIDKASLLRTYRAQTRECWLCEKIAKIIESGKEASEDDMWHFTTCVLSWANLQTP